MVRRIGLRVQPYLPHAQAARPIRAALARSSHFAEKTGTTRCGTRSFFARRKPPMSHPTIVFDLDGTLVDTAPDLVATLNAVLAREGYGAVAYKDARTMIGGGARHMLERALSRHRVALTPADLDRLFADFIAYYAEHIADRSRPFPGLEQSLDRLAAQDARLAVCTNKLERLSLLLLEQLGLAGRFAAVCGQDTFGIAKPDPELLRRTIARAGGSAANAVMVGDSFADVAVARAAGVPVIAVDFGYSDVPAALLKADRVIGHFDELADAVAAVRAR
jgi:phosphoglycolate phosphatase